MKTQIVEGKEITVYDKHCLSLSKEEVEEVLESLDEMIEEFGMASELDLYNLIGIEEPSASNKYGWIDIRNTTITRVKDRYLVKLPKVVSLY